MESGIRTNGRLRCLRPVLAEWINQHRRIGLQWEHVGDAPWWYNERANISIFAGAVWLCGGYAFEEFAQTKRGEKHRPFNGRVDLEFTVSTHTFKAEFKQCYPATTALRPQRSYIADYMEQAKTDVRAIEPHGDRRLAVVFGIPSVHRRIRTELPSRLAWLLTPERATGSPRAGTTR